jgi:asparagine synthetase B (glutamine-hydrolysing)
MCGISGIVTFKYSSTPLANINQMTTALRHRGPDDEGFAFFYPGENLTFLMVVMIRLKTCMDQILLIRRIKLIRVKYMKMQQ